MADSSEISSQTSTSFEKTYTDTESIPHDSPTTDRSEEPSQHTDEAINTQGTELSTTSSNLEDSDRHPSSNHTHQNSLTDETLNPSTTTETVYAPDTSYITTNSQSRSNDYSEYPTHSPDHDHASNDKSPAIPPKRLHISNIPFKYRENDLRQLFHGYGEIVDVEIIFNDRGSKGFGFITLADNDGARKAREELNGKVVDGRKIEINEATPRTGPPRSKS
jgi:RNA binding protein fox-1